MGSLLKSGAILFAVSFLGGCGTLEPGKKSTPSPYYWSAVSTIPQRAEIYLDGRFICTTPCRVREPVESPDHIYKFKVSKIRYKTKTVEYPNCTIIGCRAFPADILIRLSKQASNVTEEPAPATLPPSYPSHRKEKEDPPMKNKPEYEEKTPKFELSLELTGIVQGLNSYDTDINESTDSTDVSYSGNIYFDINSPMGRDNSHMQVHLNMSGQRVSEDFTGEAVANSDRSNRDFNSSLLSVSEVFYEAALLDDNLTISLGKRYPTTYFDENNFANDYTYQFLADEFANNITTEFPDYTPGFSFIFYPIDFFYISLGAFEGDSDLKKVLKDPFYIGELGISTSFANWSGNYRISLWSNKTDHAAIEDPAETRPNSGVGISLDQDITDNIGVFARFGIQDEKVSDFSQAESFGIQIKSDTSDNTFGFAYGVKHTGAPYENTSGFNGSERLFEGYYNILFNDQFQISPDLRWIKNPNGDQEEDDIFIYGLRLYSVF